VCAIQVDFHPEATVEFSESAEWYAERSSKAAREFLVAVDVAILSISSDSKRFVRIDDRHQSCRVSNSRFRSSIGAAMTVSLLQLRTPSVVPDIGVVGSAPVA